MNIWLLSFFQCLGASSQFIIFYFTKIKKHIFITSINVTFSTHNDLVFCHNFMIQGLFKLCVFIYEMLPQTEEDHWQKTMSNNYPDDFFFETVYLVPKFIHIFCCHC